MLLFELRVLVRRREFIYTLYFLTLVSVASFAAQCVAEFHNDINFTFPAYENWMALSRIYSLFPVYTFLFPLLCSLPYSDFYAQSTRSGYSAMVLTRLPRRRLVAVRAMVVFLSAFLVIAIPLAINQLLCLIAFPFDNGLTGFNSVTRALDPYRVFGLIHVAHPYVYNMLFTCLFGVIGGCFALATYAISFFFMKSRYQLLAIMNVAYMAQSIVTDSMNRPDFGYLHYVQSMGGVRGVSADKLAVLLLILLLPSAAALWVAAGKDDLAHG